MQTLSPEKQAKAVDYLKHQGRPLEQKLYAYYFENGSKQDVLDALAAFQNSDGGFGHAFEADLRLADSSVIATSVALQKLRELKVPSSNPIVQGVSRYLLNTFDSSHNAWPITPPNVNDAPHAPWWDYDPNNTYRLINPRAELVGYLLDYPDLFPQNFRDHLLESVVQHLLSLPDEIEMHDLLCYIRLSETQNLPEATRATLLEKLRRVVDKAVSRDSESWKSYGLTPLSIVASPTSPFANLFEKELPLNLDFEISRQPEEGYWSPTWSWDFASAEGWAQALKDWRSYITLANLRLFQQFGRLA